MAFKERQTFEIPEGKELKDFKIYCSKHGIINDAAVAFSYSTTNDKTGIIEKRNCIYCIACLNEYLAKLQDKGELGLIGAVPILGDKAKTEEKKED